MNFRRYLVLVTFVQSVHVTHVFCDIFTRRVITPDTPVPLSGGVHNIVITTLLIMRDI